VNINIGSVPIVSTAIATVRYAYEVGVPVSLLCTVTGETAEWSRYQV
jgi:hypothetical protein